MLREITLSLSLMLSGCALTTTSEEVIKTVPPAEKTKPAPIKPQFRVELPYKKPVPPIPQDPLREVECMSNAVAFWEGVYTSSGSNTFIYNDKTHMIYMVHDETKWKNRKQIGKSLVSKVVHKHKLSKNDVKAQLGAAKTFSSGLQNAKTYLPMIKAKLRKADMPEDLAYIPLVESSFNLKARSPVGALGAWQIMPRTLKLYMGNVNKKKLYDIEYATDVAIIILKHNYELLGSWPLAINAYHSGPGRLLKAKDALASDDICEITSSYNGKGYKTASRNYYAQFLAARKLYRQYISELLVQN